METQDIVEPPPEWNRPDEGNPNMPRRPPEYQPPQVSHFLPECWPCRPCCMLHFHQKKVCFEHFRRLTTSLHLPLAS